MQMLSMLKLFWLWTIVLFPVFCLFWTLIACQLRNPSKQRQRRMAWCPSLWLKDYFIKSFWTVHFNFCCCRALESEPLRPKGLLLLEVPGGIWGEMGVVAKACAPGFSHWFSHCEGAQRHRNPCGEMLSRSCESPERHSLQRPGGKANWLFTDELPQRLTKDDL